MHVLLIWPPEFHLGEPHKPPAYTKLPTAPHHHSPGHHFTSHMQWGVGTEACPMGEEVTGEVTEEVIPLQMRSGQHAAAVLRHTYT